MKPRPQPFAFLLLLGTILTASSLHADEAFEKFGSWTNVRISETEDPHAYGFQLDLWMHEGDLVGTLMYYSGPVADAPIGELEDLGLDRKTGELTFRTQMSIGSIRGEEPGSWVPSHDEYTFKGRIEDESLIGTLIQRVMNTDPPTTNHQEVTLQSVPDGDASPTHDAYESWCAWLDEALAARGPKE